MTAPADNSPPTLGSLAKNQHRIIDAVEALSNSVSKLTDTVTTISDGQKQLDAKFVGVNKRLDLAIKRLDNNDKRLDDNNKRLDLAIKRLDNNDKRLELAIRRLDNNDKRLELAIRRLDNNDKRLDDNNKRLDLAIKRLDNNDKRLDNTNKKLDGLMDDISLVKGGHARNETIRNASLIAHRLGYQFISEMRQEALIGFAELAKGNGVADNEAESFAKADLVMIAQDSNNRPGYIAVEVSFTVSENDVRRAMRNADYLHEFTGIRAHPAVAGVDILPEAKQQVDAGKVCWYEIPKRDIQPT